jgi:SAM-dependent methyltransferase
MGDVQARINYMNSEYIHFGQRADRSAYIAGRFGKYLQGKVLDVGCDKAVLKTLLKDVTYTGIDVGGTPDLIVDLEKVEHLPFTDNEFDATVCSDVLEHLDNLHFVFSELIRVTRRHLVISLPNNWANARRPIERGKGSIAHYGLPLEKPTDRHKWFFGYTEASHFLEQQARPGELELVEVRNHVLHWFVRCAMRATLRPTATLIATLTRSGRFTGRSAIEQRHEGLDQASLLYG